MATHPSLSRNSSPLSISSITSLSLPIELILLILSINLPPPSFNDQLSNYRKFLLKQHYPLLGLKSINQWCENQLIRDIRLSEIHLARQFLKRFDDDERVDESGGVYDDESGVKLIKSIRLGHSSTPSSSSLSSQHSRKCSTPLECFTNCTTTPTTNHHQLLRSSLIPQSNLGIGLSDPFMALKWPREILSNLFQLAGLGKGLRGIWFSGVQGIVWEGMYESGALRCRFDFGVCSVTGVCVREADLSAFCVVFFPRKISTVVERIYLTDSRVECSIPPMTPDSSLITESPLLNHPPVSLPSLKHLYIKACIFSGPESALDFLLSPFHSPSLSTLDLISYYRAYPPRTTLQTTNSRHPNNDNTEPITLLDVIRRRESDELHLKELFGGIKKQLKGLGMSDLVVTSRNVRPVGPCWDIISPPPPPPHPPSTSTSTISTSSILQGQHQDLKNSNPMPNLLSLDLIIQPSDLLTPTLFKLLHSLTSLTHLRIRYTAEADEQVLELIRDQLLNGGGEAKEGKELRKLVVQGMGRWEESEAWVYDLKEFINSPLSGIPQKMDFDKDVDLDEERKGWRKLDPENFKEDGWNLKDERKDGRFEKRFEKFREEVAGLRL